jgi:hypothetical protein
MSPPIVDQSGQVLWYCRKHATNIYIPKHNKRSSSPHRSQWRRHHGPHHHSFSAILDPFRTIIRIYRKSSLRTPVQPTRSVCHPSGSTTTSAAQKTSCWTTQTIRSSHRRRVRHLGTYRILWVPSNRCHRSSHGRVIGSGFP